MSLEEFVRIGSGKIVAAYVEECVIHEYNKECKRISDIRKGYLTRQIQRNLIREHGRRQRYLGRANGSLHRAFKDMGLHHNRGCRGHHGKGDSRCGCMYWPEGGRLKGEATSPWHYYEQAVRRKGSPAEEESMVEQGAIAAGDIDQLFGTDCEIQQYCKVYIQKRPRSNSGGSAKKDAKESKQPAKRRLSFENSSGSGFSIRGQTEHERVLRKGFRKGDKFSRDDVEEVLRNVGLW